MRRTLAPVLSARGFIVATCSSVVSTADTLASSRTYCNSLHVQSYLPYKEIRQCTHTIWSRSHGDQRIGQHHA